MCGKEETHKKVNLKSNNNNNVLQMQLMVTIIFLSNVKDVEFKPAFLREKKKII